MQLRTERRNLREQLRGTGGGGWTGNSREHLCTLVSTCHFTMSTEAAEAGPAGGGAAVSRRHTCEDGPQGRPQSGDEGPSCGDTCGSEDGGSDDAAAGSGSCKPQAMHSNSSSETCIPTPSCRICFQGAEQVGDGPVPSRTTGPERRSQSAAAGAPLSPPPQGQTRLLHVSVS